MSYIKYDTVILERKGKLVGSIKKIDANSLTGIYAEPRFEHLRNTFIVNIYIEGETYISVYIASHHTLSSAEKRYKEYMNFPEFVLLKYT